MNTKNISRKQSGKLIPFIIFVFALFLISPAISLRVQPNNYEGGRSRNLRDSTLRNQSAAAMILGEFRSSMSDMLFIKTERYLHSGVAYKLNIDYGALSSKGKVVDKKDDHSEKEHEHGEKCEHDHELPPGEDKLEFKCEGSDTLIREKAKDFRGFIGELEREVKPWLDPSQPHKHTHGTELLPWYRLMTLSDPHNVRGYMIGAWWLKRLRKENTSLEAIKFLEEGIKYNPDAFQLYLMRGQVFRSLERNKDAGASYEKAAELAMKKRPTIGRISDDWTDYNEDDALAALRLSVFIEKEYGEKKKALEMARLYIDFLGGDVILERTASKLETQLKESE
jgi:tetratricopeptide (TPR) repeat protein